MAKVNRPKYQQPTVKETPVTDQKDPTSEMPAEPAETQPEQTTTVNESPVVIDGQDAAQEEQPAPVSEPEAPAEQPQEPVTEAKPEAPADVQDEPAAQPEPTVDADVSEAQAYLNTIRETGTDTQKRILLAVEAFCDRTRPRMPIKEGDGFKAQNDFLNHMLFVLDQEPNDFDKAWSTLLIYFLEHHDFAGGKNTPSGYTALSEYRATAFRDEWTDHDRLTAYTNLITVLRTTRNPKTRKHDIKTIVLDKVSPEVINGKRLENLQRFYGV